MTHIPLLDPATVTGRARTIMDGLAVRRGRVPHMIRALANSPAALAGYSGFHAALAGGVLSPGLRERIAIAVAAANDCQTCLAAHSHFGRSEGVPEAELAAARDGLSDDPSTAAALSFALAAMKGIGHVPDDVVAAARAAGFTDGALLEIVAIVFINVFTNAVNHLAGTGPDDWPEPPPQGTNPA